jgi:hypothetical protein
VRRAKSAKSARRNALPSPDPLSFDCPVDQLKIGPYDYRLLFEDVEWERREKAHGIHDPDEPSITLSGARNRQQMADTVIHEINHAIWLISHMDDVRGQENFCARHATSFTMIARDNPAFFGWWLSLLPCP